jgi:uncharacterized protein
MRQTELLVVLCRPPGSPEAKTRLAADIGRRAADEAYVACLRHVLATAARVPADLRVAVAGPPTALAALCLELAPDAELIRQYGRTFADRQRNEIRRGLSQGYRRVAFMASDVPTVRADQIAWALTGSADEVRIVPSHDGGYSVLGSGADVAELVRTPMSRSDTRNLLVSALRTNGRSVAVADFDVPDVNVGSDMRYLEASG